MVSYLTQLSATHAVTPRSRPVLHGKPASRRLLFDEALAISDDLRLLHMQRLLLREVIKTGGGPEDAKSAFVRVHIIIAVTNNRSSCMR